MIRRALRWYWNCLRKAPVFTAGWAFGCFYGALVATTPAVARAVMGAVL